MNLGYMDVADRIEEMILSRRFKAGMRLPSNCELAEELSVSSVTVHRGLARLKDKGLINRAPRRGTYVNGIGAGNIIGVMYGESPLIARSSFARLILHYITQMAEEKGLGVKPYYPMSATRPYEPLHEAEQDISKGLLRCICFINNSGKTNAWKSTGIKIPCVQWRYTSYEDVTRMGVEHLIERGRKKIVLLSAFSAEAAAKDGAARELDALREVFEQKRLSSKGCMVKNCGQTYQYALDGYEAVSRIIKEGVKFDALQINHDLLATGAIIALLEAGMKIPGDVAVVSHANKGGEILSHIPLTTVEVDLEGIAANIVEFALNMRGSAMDQMLSPMKLVLKPGLST